MPSTTLSIDLIAGHDAAFRGLQAEVQPIEASSQLARTVNGALIDLSAPQFRKYRFTVQSNDQLPPGLDGIWPGMQVVVQLNLEFSYLTSGGSPGRAVTAGSSRVDGAFTFYRPELTCRVVNWRQASSEWTADAPWTLELEEV